MKKLCMALFYSFFLTTLASAQMQFGPKGGLSISNLNGNERDFKSKTGFNVGVFFTYNFNDYIAFQPEIYYTTKGAKDTTIEEEIHNFTILFDYIEIPLLLKFSYPIKHTVIVPSIYFGPAISFATSIMAKEEVNGLIIEGGYNYVNPVDYGFVIGGSIGFRLKKLEYGFDIRYVIGLKSIYKQDEYDFDVKNRTINIGIYLSSPF